MKKLYSLFLALFATITLSAQITFTETSAGVFTVKYNDAANGWAFYNPNGANQIGLYLWTNAAENSTGNQYNDSWTNIPVALTWSDADQAFVGTVNIATHNFNGQGGVLPGGVTVNTLHFLLTEYPAGNGAHQSSDFSANNYGFTPVTTPVLGVFNVSGLAKKSVVVEGKLFTAQKGNLTLEVYEFGGKLVKTLKVSAHDSAIDLNLLKKGLYLVKIAGATSEVVKFAY